MQLAMDEALWEAGYHRGCIHAKQTCRYEPCCIVQEVKCCADCPFDGCSVPCKLGRKKRK